MTANRSIYISVTFNCTHNPDGSFGGTASYAQTVTQPPNMGSLVGSDGTIRLDEAANYDPSVYNQNVDLFFTLATPANVQPDNTTTPVVWATQNGLGMHITVPNGGSSSEFTVVTYPDQPNLILIRDNDDDSNTYSYKPAVELTAHGNYYISLDPQIVNRPPP